MSLETKIKESAARNASLLHTLRTTDSAVPGLQEQDRYIEELERQAAVFNDRLKQLGHKRKRELKEHESYRDSVVRRLAYKAARKKEKFEARAAKEAREYFEWVLPPLFFFFFPFATAFWFTSQTSSPIPTPQNFLTLCSALEDEEQAHVMKTNVDAMLEEARTAQRELEGKVAVHTEAQKELDQLYEFVFQGPMPDFPEADARERELLAAEQSYHHAQSKAEAEWRTVQYLRQAEQQLNAALMTMDTALCRSRQDMYGGGMYVDVSGFLVPRSEPPLALICEFVKMFNSGTLTGS